MPFRLRAGRNKLHHHHISLRFDSEIRQTSSVDTGIVLQHDSSLVFVQNKICRALVKDGDVAMTPHLKSDSHHVSCEVVRGKMIGFPCLSSIPLHLCLTTPFSSVAALDAFLLGLWDNGSTQAAQDLGVRVYRVQFA